MTFNDLSIDYKVLVRAGYRSLNGKSESDKVYQELNDRNILRYLKEGQRLNRNDTVLKVLGYIFIAAVIITVGYFVFKPSNSNGTVSQHYYYCWNSGDPSPHHLGHHVSNDHYCTDSELHGAGY